MSAKCEYSGETGDSSSKQEHHTVTLDWLKHKEKFYLTKLHTHQMYGAYKYEDWNCDARGICNTEVYKEAKLSKICAKLVQFYI